MKFRAASSLKVTGREGLQLCNAWQTVAWSSFRKGVEQAGGHSTGRAETNKGGAHLFVAARVNIDKNLRENDAGAVLLKCCTLPAISRREQSVWGETVGVYPYAAADR